MEGECEGVTFFFWHTLHLPISAQAGVGQEGREKRVSVWDSECYVIKHKVSLSALRLI